MEDTTGSKVTLRNTLRRPLTFRVAGKTVRLSPGEEMKVPEWWLASAELRHMCGSGLVSAAAPKRRAADTPRLAAPEDDTRAEDTRAEDERDADAAAAAPGERKSGVKSKKKDQPES